MVCRNGIGLRAVSRAPLNKLLDVTQMSREALVVLVLLGVLFLGGVALWAVRKKANAWADQYQKAADDEARGLEGDSPIIGSRARRLSWKEAILLLAGVMVFLTAVALFQWPTS